MAFFFGATEHRARQNALGFLPINRRRCEPVVRDFATTTFK
jgi:hypothetical protein